MFQLFPVFLTVISSTTMTMLVNATVVPFLECQVAKNSLQGHRHLPQLGPQWQSTKACPAPHQMTGCHALTTGCHR
jgi:hypothetical protein